MKRKNKLKQNINYCFVCGKHLKTTKEKLGHRINPKKGNSKHNLIVVCETCKKVLQKIPLHLINTNREITEKYFSSSDLDYKKIVLQKIRMLKIKDDKLKRIYRNLE